MSDQLINRYTRIYHLLQDHFTPYWMHLVDESNQHQVPVGAESHFKLTLVSTKFRGHNRLSRHRLVNALLDGERQSGLHAFAMALYSPEEWATQPQPATTPPCQHQSPPKPD